MDSEESYFNRATRIAVSNLVALGSITISTVVGKAAVEDHVVTRHVASSRVTQPREPLETDLEEVEEVGSCPLCSRGDGDEDSGNS